MSYKTKKCKKCRATYGISRENEWCKNCRSKQKCTKFMDRPKDLTTDVKQAAIGARPPNDKANNGEGGTRKPETPDGASRREAASDKAQSWRTAVDATSGKQVNGTESTSQATADNNQQNRQSVNNEASSPGKPKLALSWIRATNHQTYYPRFYPRYKERRK